MEIVCAPETYRRFESSSLRHANAPIDGCVFFVAQRRALRNADLSEVRASAVRTVLFFLPLATRRRKALPTCLAISSSFPTKKDSRVGAILRLFQKLKPPENRAVFLFLAYHVRIECVLRAFIYPRIRLRFPHLPHSPKRS